jgi:hypothetical protein
MPRILAVAAGLAALALAAPALAQHPAPSAAPATGETRSLQGASQAAWINDPHIHAFYELTQKAFAAGPDKVDQAAYTRASYDLFRAFAVSMHAPPEKMVDHLKLIPGQMVQIAKEDPSVLKSYDAFVAAMFGPP